MWLQLKFIFAFSHIVAERWPTGRNQNFFLLLLRQRPAAGLWVPLAVSLAVLPCLPHHWLTNTGHAPEDEPGCVAAPSDGFLC